MADSAKEFQPLTEYNPTVSETMADVIMVEAMFKSARRWPEYNPTVRRGKSETELENAKEVIGSKGWTMSPKVGLLSTMTVE